MNQGIKHRSHLVASHHNSQAVAHYLLSIHRFGRIHRPILGRRYTSRTYRRWLLGQKYLGALKQILSEHRNCCMALSLQQL